MNKNNDNNNFNKSFLEAYGYYGGIGFQFALLVVAGVFGGRYLDEKLDTAPLFLIIGVLLGSAAGFFVLYKAFMLSKKNKDNDNTNATNGPKT